MDSHTRSDPAKELVGQKLGEACDAAGVQAEVLAKFLGVGYLQVQKYYRGISLPPFVTMCRIAKFLDVSVSEFAPPRESL